MKKTSISMLAAWALAFGCAIGWDAVVLPWTTFLPAAGPAGMVIGILAGAVAMAVVAWNYHYMVNRHPGPGGAYTYATKVFGHDHGFICAWFLCLVYVAIVWMDAVALVMVSQFAFGDAMRFGFSLTVAGHDVNLGGIALSAAAMVLAAAICCRRSVACRAQIALVAVFAAGIVACFCSVMFGHDGGIRSALPVFAPDGGNPLWQVLRIVSVAPWLFVGFESISQASDEFGFQRRRSFPVMASALAAATAGYVMLTAIPVFSSVAGGWVEALGQMGQQKELHAFATAGACLGKAGVPVVGLTLVGLIFTNLIGNMFAAGRLLSAMADDGVLPAWFGGKGADDSPRNAIIAITCVSLAVVSLGKSVIGIIVDTSLVGAAVAYAYTSAATFKTARASGNRASAVVGGCGLAISVLLILLYIVPNLLSEMPLMMSTESYLVLIAWCIAGLVSFLSLFRGDRRQRFGRSTVAWISLLAVILAMSLMWMRQRTYETTGKAFDDIVNYHLSSHVRQGENPGLHEEWQDVLRRKLSRVNRSIVLSSLVQGALIVMSLMLMVCIYAILRRRERDHELEKARAKSYFFSTVSHDIRTPLNAIIGYSTMLESGFKTEAERKEAVDAILMSSKTLLGLVNDILDLSKLESGKMAILPEPTDCPRLMNAVMDAFRVSSGGRDIELRCNVGAMPLLMLDPQRLRQIVFNLVGNAVKFTEKGHVELRATFNMDKDADEGDFRLEVEDTGCGINEEDLKQVGSAYVQVGTNMSRNGGTGLGLAICKQLMSAMGGRMEVSSKLGVGSTFSVVIPHVKVAQTASDAQESVPPVQGAATGARSVATEAETGAPLPHRILLVDDSKMNLMVLKALMRKLGEFDITTANDGKEALDMLTDPGTEPFDLVMTDMWMPRLDGVGLVSAIRQNPSLAALPVLAVTADVELRDKAAEMGFNGILLKPITPDTLGKALSCGS